MNGCVCVVCVYISVLANTTVVVTTLQDTPPQWNTFTHEKKRNPAVSDNMDKPRGHYAKWDDVEHFKYYMISPTCRIWDS